MTSPQDPHADKFNDPRVQITWRSWALAGIVLVGACVFTFFSVQARRTSLVETTRFWGPTTIQAIQLGDRVVLQPLQGDRFEPIELTAFPGLGHLRKALLHEFHYEWDSESNASVASRCSEDENTQAVQLEFSDPTLNRFQPARIAIELNNGIVGPADKPRSVKLNDRVRPAMAHQISLLMKVKQQSYDERD